MEDYLPRSSPTNTQFQDVSPTRGPLSESAPVTQATRGSGWSTTSQILKTPLNQSEAYINDILKGSGAPSWAKQYPTSGVPGIKYTGYAQTAYSLWKALRKGRLPGPWGALTYLQYLEQILELLQLLGDQWAYQGSTDAMTPPGWTLCPTPSCHGETDYYVNFVNETMTCAVFGSCPTGQALPETDHPNAGPGFVYNTARNGTLLAKHDNADQAPIGSTDARYTIKYQYWHPLDADGNPYIRALPLPMDQPPLSQPVPDPPPDQLPIPDQSADPAPNTRPADNLHIEITPSGNPPYLPPSKPGKHYLRPDRARKPRLADNQAVAVVSKLYGELTEFKDFINALADAIPKRKGFNGCSGKLGQKTQCVLDNWESINWRKALLNLVVNQAQDWSIGKVNAWANQITQNPYWMKPVGPNAEYGSKGTAGADIPSDVRQQQPEWETNLQDWASGLMQ